MMLNRRNLIKLGGAGLLQGIAIGLAGCNGDQPLPRTLESRLALPPSFASKLPRQQALAPTASSQTSDRYDLSAIETTSNIQGTSMRASGSKGVVYIYNGNDNDFDIDYDINGLVPTPTGGTVIYRRGKYWEVERSTKE